MGDAIYSAKDEKGGERCENITDTTHSPLVIISRYLFTDC